MRIRELAVPDSYEVTPVLHTDDRGTFFEWYRFDQLSEAVGHRLDLRQANASISARGVVRGIHFADVGPGQAKYVMAASGSVIDFVVDLRVGSPTFGTWDSVLLDAIDHRAVYIAEGLGHAFVALEDDTTVTYLVSDVYRQNAEHGVSPFDPTIGLDFPADLELIVSPKDAEAPGFEEAAEAGLLPTWEACMARYEQLNREGA